ncbi:MAG: hypothetical protein FWE52_00730 [Alphaproteobacteria bacterium]|nr:hypothetical protein [Alphaproteobacteria bacterium]
MPQISLFFRKIALAVAVFVFAGTIAATADTIITLNKMGGSGAVAIAAGNVGRITDPGDDGDATLVCTGTSCLLPNIGTVRRENFNISANNSLWSLEPNGNSIVPGGFARTFDSDTTLYMRWVTCATGFYMNNNNCLPCTNKPVSPDSSYTGGGTGPTSNCAWEYDTMIILDKAGGSGTASTMAARGRIIDPGGTDDAIWMCWGRDCNFAPNVSMTRANSNWSPNATNAPWCTEPNGGGTCFAQNTIHRLTPGTRVYVNWNCSTTFLVQNERSCDFRTVTLNKSGGSGTITGTMVGANSGTDDALVTCSATHCTLPLVSAAAVTRSNSAINPQPYWCTEPNGGGTCFTANANLTTIPLDATLYLRWNCVTGYYRDGDTCVPCNNAPVNSTYTTRGDGPTSNCAWECNTNHTLQDGECVPNTGVTFNMSGGSGVAIPPLVCEGTTCMLPIVSGITRANSELAKDPWCTEPMGGGTCYADGSGQILSVDTELHLHWICDTGFIAGEDSCNWRLRLNKSGGSGEITDAGAAANPGTSEVIFACAGASCALPDASHLTRANSVLADNPYWCTGQTGGGTCYAGGSTYDFFSAPMLYLSWTCNSGWDNFSYDACGRQTILSKEGGSGTITGTRVTDPGGTDDAIVLCSATNFCQIPVVNASDVTREYSFIGASPYWCTGNQGQGTCYAGGTSATLATTRLRLKWACDPGLFLTGYACVFGRVTLSKTGGSGTISGGGVEDNTGTTNAILTCTNLGCTLPVVDALTRANSTVAANPYWCTARNGGGTCYESGSTQEFTSQNTNLFLRWTCDNGYRFTTATADTCSACTNAPAGAQYTGPSAGLTNDCPWECNTGYTQVGNTCVRNTVISFDLYGGTGDIPDLVCAGTSCTLPGVSGFTRPYSVLPTQLHWCRDAACSGGTYEAGSTHTITEDTRLYLRWDCETGFASNLSSCDLLVHLDKTGGSGVLSGNGIPANSAADLIVWMTCDGTTCTLPDASHITRANSSLVANPYWCTELMGGGTCYNGGSVQTLSAGATLYLHWTCNTNFALAGRACNRQLRLNKVGGTGTILGSQITDSGGTDEAILLCSGNQCSLPPVNASNMTRENSVIAPAPYWCSNVQGGGTCYSGTVANMPFSTLHLSWRCAPGFFVSGNTCVSGEMMLNKRGGIGILVGPGIDDTGDTSAVMICDGSQCTLPSADTLTRPNSVLPLFPYWCVSVTDTSQDCWAPGEIRTITSPSRFSNAVELVWACNSGFRMQSVANQACVACTNAPANSTYIGPSPNNTNTCPWECNTGFSLTATNQCGQMCTAGFTTLRVGDLEIPLYNTKMTTHALGVSDGTNICYASLATGAGPNALNVHINGTTYRSTY